MTFLKGQSGNPKGRPVGSRNKKTIAREAILNASGKRRRRHRGPGGGRPCAGDALVDGHDPAAARPRRDARLAADQHARGCAGLGEDNVESCVKPGKDEISTLSVAFNRMREGLKHAMDMMK